MLSSTHFFVPDLGLNCLQRLSDHLAIVKESTRILSGNFCDVSTNLGSKLVNFQWVTVFSPTILTD